MKQSDLLKKLEKLTTPRVECEEDVIHAGNFAKLALYLNSAKIPEEKFTMEWIIDNRKDDEFKCDYPALAKKKYNECGTSACALGHAPLAGIKPRPGMSWGEYDTCMLTDSLTDEWEHCFDASWGGTAKDAAKRIAYMLLTGRTCPYVNADDFNKLMKSYRPRWSVLRKHANDRSPWILRHDKRGGWTRELRTKGGFPILPPLSLSSRSAESRS